MLRTLHVIDIRGGAVVTSGRAGCKEYLIRIIWHETTLECEVSAGGLVQPFY